MQLKQLRISADYSSRKLAVEFHHRSNSVLGLIRIWRSYYDCIVSTVALLVSRLDLKSEIS